MIYYCCYYTQPLLVANRGWNGWKMTNYSSSHRRLPTKKKKPQSPSFVLLPLLIHNAPERRLHIKTRASHFFSLSLPPTAEKKISLFYPLQTAVIPPRDWPAAVITHAEPRARRALTFDVAARHLWVTRRRSLPSNGGGGGSRKRPQRFLRSCFFYICGLFFRRHLKNWNDIRMSRAPPDGRTLGWRTCSTPPRFITLVNHAASSRRSCRARSCSDLWNCSDITALHEKCKKNKDV